MPLIVIDDELFRSPGGLMHFLHQLNPISFQRICRSCSIVSFKVEVEVFPLIHELDSGVLLGSRRDGRRRQPPARTAA